MHRMFSFFDFRSLVALIVIMCDKRFKSYTFKEGYGATFSFINLAISVISLCNIRFIRLVLRCSSWFARMSHHPMLDFLL